MIELLSSLSYALGNLDDCRQLGCALHYETYNRIK